MAAAFSLLFTPLSVYNRFETMAKGFVVKTVIERRRTNGEESKD